MSGFRDHVGHAVHRHAEEEVVGHLARRRRASRPCVAGRGRAPVVCGCQSIPRSANAASSAFDASGDGGIGTGKRHHERDAPIDRGCPRSVRKSCINSAVSLGAGGHLNGADVTATITRPPSKFGEHVAQRERAGARCRTRSRPRRARASPPGADRRRARRRGCRRRRCRRRSRPASRSGSIERIVDCTNCTPGLTKSRYGWRTCSDRARPNITSSFENPNTKSSVLSMSTTSTSAPNSSDSRVVNSSPPNPAPSTTTRMAKP